MTVSVIIPTSKPDRLALTLTALCHQTMPKADYEVIVIDDSDDTEVENIIQRQPSDNISRIAGNAHNRSMLRNQGMMVARGDILLFLDDDMITSPNLIQSHVDYQSQFDVVITGDNFRVLSIWHEDWYKSLSTFDQSMVLETGGQDIIAYINRVPDHLQLLQEIDIIEHFQDIWKLAYTRKNFVRELGEDLTGFYIPWYSGGAGNMSVKYDAAKELQGFDECFHGWGLEDIEFEYRLYHYGCRFAFGHKSIAFHQLHPRRWEDASNSNQLNFARFCRKHQSPVVNLFFHFRMRPGFSGADLLEYNEIARRYMCGTLPDKTLHLAQREYAKAISATTAENNLQGRAF